MTTPEIGLLMIKTRHMELARAFYGYLGFVFQREQHGNGPEHYASMGSQFVFEIYPLQSWEALLASHMRLGFYVDNIYSVTAVLALKDIELIEHLQATDFGLRTIAKDPDGRCVEIYQNTVVKL